MYKESASKLFFRYAFPQMIGLLFNSVYIIVDGIFIGIRLGSSALAAAGVAVPIVEFLIALSIGMTSGAGVVISGKLAVNDKISARNAFQAALLLQGFTGLLIAIMGNLFMKSLARLLGATDDILELTVTYLRYIITLSPFLLFSYLLGGLVRNDGRPNLAMAALSIGSLSNILLDYIFMYPFDMGLAGAALATAIGPVISVMTLLPHFLRKRGSLFFQKLRPDFHYIPEFIRLGFPSFVMEFSIGMVTFFMNIGINRYGFGEGGLAAYLLIGYLMLIFLTLFLGMAEGLQPVFSYLSAASEKEKLQRLLKIAVTIFLALGVLSYVLSFLFSGYFYSIFSPDSPALSMFAAEKSKYYFAGFFAAGLNILMISYYQSTKASGKALLLSLLRGCILPSVFVFILPSLIKSDALWVCHSAAEISTLAIFFFIRSRENSLQ